MPKVFNGKILYKKWGNLTKAEAEKKKKSEKAKGYLVRIIPATDKYRFDVFVRQSR